MNKSCVTTLCCLVLCVGYFVSCKHVYVCACVDTIPKKNTHTQGSKPTTYIKVNPSQMFYSYSIINKKG